MKSTKEMVQEITPEAIRRVLNNFGEKKICMERNGKNELQIMFLLTMIMF